MSKFPKGLAHDFPKNLNILLRLIFFEEYLHMILIMFSMKKKKGFQTTKMSFQNAGKMSTIPKGSSHDFPQTFKVLLSLILLEKDLDICFIML